jgi:NAD(P)H dehydrogenase (quinone)
MSQSPIPVTDAAGRIGGVGGGVVDILRSKGLAVRALVRTDDDRAEAPRVTGAEADTGPLTERIEA